MDSEDQRIAILQLLGWTDIREDWTTGDERAHKALMGIPPGGATRMRAPWYPHDIDTAIPLLLQMVNKGWHCTITPDTATATCTMVNGSDTISHEAHQNLSWPATYMVAEAICGAYLKAHNLYTT